MIRKLMAGVLLAALSVTAVIPATVSASGEKNIVERAIQVNKATGLFDTLLTAATCEGFDGAIAKALATTQDITLFAPTDYAFSKLGLNTENVCDLPAADLADILTYHVYADGAVSYRTAVRLSPATITMLNGDPAQLTGSWFTLRIDGARVILPNVWASNGVIHVVNSVLLP